MSSDLDEAVYTLLTPARDVIDRHAKDGAGQCHLCGVAWPCFEMGTAIGALDLVIRVHVAIRRQPDPATGLPSTARGSVREDAYRRMAPACYESSATGSPGVAAPAL